MGVKTNPTLILHGNHTGQHNKEHNTCLHVNELSEPRLISGENSDSPEWVVLAGCLHGALTPPI